MTNKFEINVNEQVQVIFGMLNDDLKEKLLLGWIEQECTKKVKEINKNYSEPEAFPHHMFAHKIFERLAKKSVYNKVRREMLTYQIDAEQLNTQELKSTPSKKATAKK